MQSKTLLCKLTDTSSFSPSIYLFTLNLEEAIPFELPEVAYQLVHPRSKNSAQLRM